MKYTRWSDIKEQMTPEERKRVDDLIAEYEKQPWYEQAIGKLPEDAQGVDRERENV